MRDRHVVTPFRASQNKRLRGPSSLAQKSLRRIGQHTKYNLVKLFFLRSDIVIRVIRIVHIFRLSSSPQHDFDSGCSGDDLSQLSVESDLTVSGMYLAGRGE